jgi:hypothetical protein
MPVDFFEKEFATVCERFNQTFGKQTVCNLKTRYRVIIAIIQMGMLNKKIGKTKDKYEVRDDIIMFNRVRDTLMTIFSNAERVWQERRCYDNGNQANKRPGQRSNVG